MISCSTTCPNCKSKFQCCTPSLQPPASWTPCCRNFNGLGKLPMPLLPPCLSTGGGCKLPPLPREVLLPTESLFPSLSPPMSPRTPFAIVTSTPEYNVDSRLVPPQPHPAVVKQRLLDTGRALSLCGWYYENLTYQESDAMLRGTETGTFLVRNSSDPRFLYSLSVQTERGPTSVRLYAANGCFRLDAQLHLQAAMPVFPSVIELVAHYVHHSKLYKDNTQVWVDNQGKLYASIYLKKPLVKRTSDLSLKHLSRLAVNKVLMANMPRVSLVAPPVAKLELPNSLVAYLQEYPYAI